MMFAEALPESTAHLTYIGGAMAAIWIFGQAFRFVESRTEKKTNEAILTNLATQTQSLQQLCSLSEMQARNMTLAMERQEATSAIVGEMKRSTTAIELSLPHLCKSKSNQH